MNSSLASLLKRSTIDDHDEVLRESEKALKAKSSDVEAQQTKAIALLKLEKYADAISYFEATPGLQDSIPEAYAYCLYRSGKFEEAVKVASAVNGSRGAQHVTLQAAYRAEDWDAAQLAHAALSEAAVSKEEFDLRVNKLALDAEGLWLQKLSAGGVARPTTDDLAAFDTAYNTACISVAKGQLQEADVLLKRAISLCEHHEEYSDETKILELVPLRAQRVFILQSLGKSDEANSLAIELQDSLKDTAVDASTRKLAESNIIAATGSINPFIAHKVFKETSIPEDDRLFSYQSSGLLANERTVQFQAFKHEGFVDAAKRRAKSGDFPTLSQEDLLTSMFAVAAQARGEVSKAAIRKVLPELEKRPNDAGLIVTIVQLYILTGNATAAVDMLHTIFERLETSTSEKDLDVRYSPGLVGLMVSLYRSQNRRSQLKQELAKSASYWRTKSKAPPLLLRAAGTALLESSRNEDADAARVIFEKLYLQEPGDQSTVAGYVASHALSPSEDIQSLADKLTPIAELTSPVDADALEHAGIPQAANALAIAQAGQSRKRAAVDASSGKSKRIRKSRLPKDYDPDKKPDPERWLPLRDRSTYRPKKKKGKKDDRTQGGGNVNESLDISNRPTGSGSEVVTGNQGGGKKKKGKGKK